MKRILACMVGALITLAGALALAVATLPVSSAVPSSASVRSAGPALLGGVRSMVRPV
jgi:hypothetical protein